MYLEGGPCQHCKRPIEGEPRIIKLKDEDGTHLWVCKICCDAYKDYGDDVRKEWEEGLVRKESKKKWKYFCDLPKMNNSTRFIKEKG